MSYSNPFKVFGEDIKIENQFDDESCPVCGIKIDAEVTICPNCKEIIKSDDIDFEDEELNEEALESSQKKEGITRPPIVELMIWSICGTILFTLISIIFIIKTIDSHSNLSIILWGTIAESALLFLIGGISLTSLIKNSRGIKFWPSILLIECLITDITYLFYGVMEENIVSSGNSIVSIIICIFFLGYIFSSGDFAKYRTEVKNNHINIFLKTLGILSLIFVGGFNIYLLISM